jgi:hypothetical protein
MARYQCSLPVNWLMMYGSSARVVMAGLLFGYWVAALLQPLAVAETGVCKRRAASQEPKKQRGLRAAHGAKPRLSFWVEAA